MVLPYIKMNLPQVYMCSPSWTLHPPSSPYHPSGSSQCTSPKHPVSCIKPGLATHFIYDIIHISMPFSRIIPPSSSPTESKRLFYTSGSLLLSRIQGYSYHLSKFHIYVLVYCIGVFLFWLTSLCIIVSSFIHLIRTDSNVFFLMAKYYSIGEGNGTPFQYSCLENPIDRGAWWPTVQRVSESDTTEELAKHKKHYYWGN